MSAKHSERRIRQRLKAWQALPQSSSSPARAASSTPAPLQLAQRLEERRRGRAQPPPVADPVLLSPPASAEAEVPFRAGQIWRKLDRQMEFIVDSSDGEQIEIRWFHNLQWSAPQVLSVHDLLAYVRSKSIRVDWPKAGR